MKIIITGGSGFIGTNLLDFFLKHNYNVINYDIDTPRNPAHFIHWTKINILDKEKLAIQLNIDQPEFIIHLAARTDLNEKKDIKGYDVNINGVENIMDLSSKLKSLKRIIIASSMLVCRLGYIPRDFNDYAPNNLYGESKVLTEKIVKRYKTNWVIIRPTSIWGPWFREPYLNFFKLVIKGLYFNIPESFASTKTYGYVENTCNQIYAILIAEDDKVLHKYFYIGDEDPINISKWADLIRSQLNKSKLIILPVFFLKLGSKIGDFLLKYFKIKNFPLNTFRFNNMTTNNIIKNVKETNSLIEDTNSIIKIQESTKRTIDWISINNK
jgi:nucleoside-diphosphate-sugar epimerase